MSMTATEAKRVVLSRIGNLPGIAGVGIGWDEQGKSCVRVNVDPDQITPKVRADIPKELEGVRIEVVDILHLKAAGEHSA